MPPAPTWYGGARKYVSAKKTDQQDVFRCPIAPSQGSYGFNAALGGVREESMEYPAETMVLFETDAPGRSFSRSSAAISGLRVVTTADTRRTPGSRTVMQKQVGKTLWKEIRWSPYQEARHGSEQPHGQ